MAGEQSPPTLEKQPPRSASIGEVGVSERSLSFDVADAMRPRASTGGPLRVSALPSRRRVSSIKEHASSFVTMARTVSGAKVSGFQGLAGVAIREGDEADDTEAPKLSVAEAVMTMAISCIGAGVTTFPKVMADVGMIPAPLLCIAATLACLECGLIVVECCGIVEIQTGSMCDSFETLASFFGGPRCHAVVGIIKNFAFFGFVVVFIVLFSESVEAMMPGPVADLTSTHKSLIRFGIVLPIFCCLAMLTNLSQLARWGWVGIVSVIIECGGIMFGGVDAYLRVKACDSVAELSCRRYAWVPESAPVESGGKGAAVFLFTLAVIGAVPNLRSQLAEPKEMPRVLYISFSIVTACNVIVMYIGYMGFGQYAPDNAIVGLKLSAPWVSFFASVAIGVNVLFSTPLYTFSMFTQFEESGNDILRTPLSLPNIALRIGLVTLMTIISAVVPYLTDVIGLVSAIFVGCLNIFFPLYFFYMSLTRTQRSIHSALLSARFLGHVAVFIIGVYVLIFGFLGSYNSLMTKIAAAGDQEFTARLPAQNTTSLMASMLLWV